MLYHRLYPIVKRRKFFGRLSYTKENDQQWRITRHLTTIYVCRQYHISFVFNSSIQQTTGWNKRASTYSASQVRSWSYGRWRNRYKTLQVQLSSCFEFLPTKEEANDEDASSPYTPTHVPFPALPKFFPLWFSKEKFIRMLKWKEVVATGASEFLESQNP